MLLYVCIHCIAITLRKLMEEDFVFLHSSSTFFTWMAVAHIHTSIQNEAFTKISRLYNNKYNTSNDYIDAYVKTYTRSNSSSNTFIKLEQQSLFSPIFFPPSPILCVYLTLLSFLSPWNSKLIIFHYIPCDLM